MGKNKILVWTFLIIALVCTVTFAMATDLKTITSLSSYDLVVDSKATFTDDNTNEDLYIYTDEETYYSGFSGQDIYLKIENTKLLEENIDIKIYGFDDYTIKKIVGNGTETLDKYGIDKLEPQPANKKEVVNATAVKRFYDTIDKYTYYHIYVKKTDINNNKFYVEAVGDKGAYGHLDPIISGIWKRKHKITIPANFSSTDLDGYQYLITNNQLKNEVWNTSSSYYAKSDGCDLRFSYDINGTNEIPVDTVSFNQNDQNGSEIWIRVDINKNTATNFYVWYNNSAANCYEKTDTYGAYNVWEDGMVVVHSGLDQDYTPNALAISRSGGVGINTVNGVIGTASFVDGINDTAQSAPITLQDDGFTGMMWIKYNESSQYPFSFYNGADENNLIELQVNAANILYRLYDNAGDLKIKYSHVTTLHTWYNLAFTWNGTDAQFYLNGVNTSMIKSTDLALNRDDDTGYFLWGKKIDNSSYFNGTFDEVRFFNRSMTAEEINARYRSDVTNNPAYASPGSTAVYRFMNLTFYDGNTNSIIDDKNVTIDIIGSNYAYNFTTDAGSIQESLQYDTYNLIYSADGYPANTRQFTHNGLNNAYLELYLYNYSNSIDITMVVLDQYTNRIPSATIHIWQFFSDENKFKQIQDVTTNMNGEATVSLVPQSELYRYVVEYQGSTIWNNSNVAGELVGLNDEEYIFNTYIGEDVYTLSRILDAVSGSIAVNTTAEGNVSQINGTYTFVFTQPTAYEICMNIKRLGTITTETGYNGCVNSTSSSLVWHFNMTESTAYSAIVSLEYQGSRYYIDGSYNSYTIAALNPFDRDTNYEGWFFAIVGIIAAVMLFTKYPVLALITVEAVFLILLKTRILQISGDNKAIMIVSVFITAIIAYLVYRGDTDD